MKANYSTTGDVITLEWDRGCFHPLGGMAKGPKTMDEKCADSARETQVNGLILQALDTLRKQARNVSASPQASNSAVKVMGALPPFQQAKIRRKEIAQGLQRLFDEGRIRNGMAVWQKTSRHWAEGIGRVEWDQPEDCAT